MNESTVFVVRVWRDLESFRATARVVDSDQFVVFSKAAELLQFLASRTNLPPCADRPASPDSMARGKRRKTRKEQR